MSKKKYIFTWYESASKHPEWINYKKYDKHECTIEIYPDNIDENYIIKFDDGTVIGVEEYEIEEIK